MLHGHCTNSKCHIHMQSQQQLESCLVIIERCVEQQHFNLSPNAMYDSVVLRDADRAFQARAEATGNARSSSVVRREVGHATVHRLLLFGSCYCSYSTVPQKIEIKLPLSVNKFMEPAEMDASQFFQRWKLLSQ